MFGKGYARVWFSQKPDYVAKFFSGVGSLTVIGGDPAVGREAIAGVAGSFMMAFPDMVVLMDSLVQSTEGTAFHRTLIGTNSGPGGTGNNVRISRVER